MLNGLRTLDRVLRGEATRPAQLVRGIIDVPMGGMTFVMVLLTMFYGACMGIFALLTRWGTPRVHDGLWQILSSTLKVPALLILTLIVTCPSLYVFNALLGSRLTMGALLRLLGASIGVLAALLASFGTILLFFSLCTDSYSFIILLNVVLFAVSGGLGLGFLLQTLHRLVSLTAFAPPPVPESTSASIPTDTLPPEAVPLPGPLDQLKGQMRLRSVRRVFFVWVIVFALVGGQMSWVLRPFILAPTSDFVLFRPRESNFFQAVFARLSDLVNGSPHGKGGGWSR